MIRLSILVLTLAMQLSATASDIDSIKNRDEVVAFFKDNVMGKTVASRSKKAEDEDFAQTWSYSNLQVTERGFTYDEKIEIKQTTYVLDEGGKRKGAGDVRDRSYENLTSVGMREGTLYLLGVKIPVKSSFRDMTGSAYSIDGVKLDSGKLVIEFTDVGFTTWPKRDPKDGMDLIRSKYVETLWVDDNGKLNRTFTQVTSYLDPQTLKVTSTKPEWRSDQIED